MDKNRKEKLEEIKKEFREQAINTWKIQWYTDIETNRRKRINHEIEERSPKLLTQELFNEILTAIPTLGFLLTNGEFFCHILKRKDLIWRIKYSKTPAGYGDNVIIIESSEKLLQLLKRDGFANSEIVLPDSHDIWKEVSRQVSTLPETSVEHISTVVQLLIQEALTTTFSKSSANGISTKR